MKISLITTVLNEEKTVNELLNSVFAQTKLPDEIIIVDGGSTDNTAKIIHDSRFMLHNSKLKPKVFIKKGNRSVGRNFAIEQASGDIIVCTDGGCILDRNWIKNISKPFEHKKVDVVSGFYKPETKSTFEKCLAAYTCVMPDRVDPENFFPSSRSIAFKKEAWEKAGGYPEELDTCEDLVFDKKLKRAGLRFVFAKNAIVYWPQRKNIIAAASQFYKYAKGDGQSFYIRPNTPFLFFRYIVGLLLLILAITTKSNFLFIIIYLLIPAYILWSILKNYKYVEHPRAFIYLPALQITADIAVVSGMSVGFFSFLTEQTKDHPKRRFKG